MTLMVYAFQWGGYLAMASNSDGENETCSEGQCSIQLFQPEVRKPLQFRIMVKYPESVFEVCYCQS